MSREFITPLVISGSKEQQLDIAKELVKLGYKWDSINERDKDVYPILCTNFGPQAGRLGWITKEMIEARVRCGSLLINASHKQLILALAAMSKDKSILYKEEYYKFNDKIGYSFNTREIISEVKLTKEEIVTYFNNKAMNESIESNEYGSISYREDYERSMSARSVTVQIKPIDYYVLTSFKSDNVIIRTKIIVGSALYKELAIQGLLHLLTPIYKDQEKVIKILVTSLIGIDKSLEVTIKDNKAHCEGQTFTKEQLRSMLISPSTVSRIGSIDFGCNFQYRVSREEIEKVIKEM